MNYKIVEQVHSRLILLKLHVLTDNDRILCITETVCRRYYRSSQIKN